MARKNTKVVQYKKPLKLNVGALVFLGMFLYIAIQVIRYYNTDHLAIYEVTETSIADDNTYTAIALRQEKIYKTEQAGYINYYVAEGDRIGKNSVVYTVDESGDTYDLLSSSENIVSLTDQDAKEVRNSISEFRSKYSDSNYNELTNFEYNIQNTIMELTNINMLNSLNDILKDSNTKSFDVIKAKASGIVSYMQDGFESLKTDDISEKTFDTENYKRNQLRTTELKDKDTSVYKLVTDEDWSLVIPLTDNQYKELKEKDSVRLTFTKDKLSTRAKISFFNQDGNHYAQLSLSKYMVRYVSERYLEIKIQVSSVKGLKIPVTSVIEKDFYKIPLVYFMTGGENSATGVTTKAYDKDGKVETTFVPTTIYYKDDAYGYVDTNVLDTNSVILLPDNAEGKAEYTISEAQAFKGVYNVNKGYCVFRMVDIIYENPEYYIVNTNTDYGLSTFDHIVIDASLAVEQKIIK